MAPHEGHRRSLPLMTRSFSLGLLRTASCSELRTSAALLENISRFLLTIAENITSSLLGLDENELTMLRMNSQISGSAHNH